MLRVAETIMIAATSNSAFLFVIAFTGLCLS